MNFREYNQEQGRFLQINLSKAIEEDHPAKIVNDIIEMMDLTDLYAKYAVEGNPSYHPKMMLKVLFYSYIIGIYSCRKIRARLKDFNLPFLYLSAGDMPTFCTINNFRQRHLDELPGLFTQIVMLCVELGMVDFGFLAIDGQKIQANASFRESKTRAGLQKDIRRIEKKLKKILKRDASENSAEETAAAVKKLERRTKTLENALSKIDEMIAAEKDEKKHEKMRINVTDNDAPVMTHKDGTKKPSYETYAAVDAKHQVITAYDCMPGMNEAEQVVPMIIQSYYNAGGNHHGAVGLDSGFSSLDNLTLLDGCPFDVLMPDRMFDKWLKDGPDMAYDKSKFQFDKETMCVTCPAGKAMKLRTTMRTDDGERYVFIGTECGECPSKDGCTKSVMRTVVIDTRDDLVNAMRETLKTEAGKKEYRKRMYTVEPVFGNMQKNSGWRQFYLRGEEKAKGEFGIHAIAHNLKKIIGYVAGHTIDWRLALCQTPGVYRTWALC